MEEKKIKLIFVLNEDDPALRAKARFFIETNNRVIVIDKEYIYREHDKGMTPYEDIKDPDIKKVRRDSSIMAFLSTNQRKGYEFDIILDIDTMNKEVAAKYSNYGKDTGHELRSFSIEMIAPSTAGNKFVMYLKSDYFAVVSEMIQNSTLNARIISSGDENQRFRDFTGALHESSPLIIVNADNVSDLQKGHFKAFGDAFGHGILNLRTGNVDVSSPILKIDGKEYKERELSEPGQTASNPKKSDTGEKKKFLWIWKDAYWRKEFPDKVFWWQPEWKNRKKSKKASPASAGSDSEFTEAEVIQTVIKEKVEIPDFKKMREDLQEEAAAKGHNLKDEEVKTTT